MMEKSYFPMPYAPCSILSRSNDNELSSIDFALSHQASQGLMRGFVHGVYLFGSEVIYADLLL